MKEYRGLITAILFSLLIPLALVSAGCSWLQYLTGNKAIPLQPYTGQPQRAAVYHLGEWTIARASLHNHTTFSDGQRTPEDLLLLARQSGMAVLSYTDHREGGVCFRKGLCLPINGIEKVGYEKYFEVLNRIKAANPDLIILIGAEVIPYFYNVGKAPNFVLFGENYHFVVWDIHDPKVFWDMPARRELRSLKPEPLPGMTPYQKFVDYITDHGGIVEAAHVESGQDQWEAGLAHFISPGPVHNITDLSRLALFSIVPEAYHQFAGGAGGGWDADLIAYLLGARDQVPWAMGDADYHGPQDNDSLARGTTLLYMREFTEAEVYRCFREGRMVALMGQSFQDSYVAEFSAAGGNEPPKNPIMFGEKVILRSAPRVRFRLDHEVPAVKARLIRNGVVVKEVPGCSIDFTDEEMWSKNLPAVYRVELVGPRIEVKPEDKEKLMPESELFTNPIFVYLMK